MQASAAWLALVFLRWRSFCNRSCRFCTLCGNNFSSPFVQTVTCRASIAGAVARQVEQPYTWFGKLRSLPVLVCRCLCLR